MRRRGRRSLSDPPRFETMAREEPREEAEEESTEEVDHGSWIMYQ